MFSNVALAITPADYKPIAHRGSEKLLSYCPTDKREINKLFAPPFTLFQNIKDVTFPVDEVFSGFHKRKHTTPATSDGDIPQEKYQHISTPSPNTSGGKKNLSSPQDFKVKKPIPPHLDRILYKYFIDDEATQSQAESELDVGTSSSDEGQVYLHSWSSHWLFLRVAQT